MPNDNPNIGKKYRVYLITDDPSRNFDFLLLPVNPDEPPIIMSHSNALNLSDDIKTIHNREYNARMNKARGSPCVD